MVQLDNFQYKNDGSPFFTEWGEPYFTTVAKSTPQILKHCNVSFVPKLWPFIREAQLGKWTNCDSTLIRVLLVTP
jgi:hypothetical protein